MSRFIQAIKTSVRRVAQSCLEVWLSSTGPVDPSREPVRKILVFAYHGLGNFILYTPALKLLRERFPDARIDLQVGNNTGCEEVLAGSIFFDNVYNLPHSAGMLAWFKRAAEVRQTSYDLTINEFHSHSWRLALLVAASGARLRLGHVTSPGWGPQFSHYSFVFNIPVKMREDEHEIERYLDLITPLGIARIDHRTARTFMHLRPEDREFTQRFLKESGAMGARLLIGFQPGTSATMRWKQWPVDRYRTVIERLIDSREDLRVMLFGSASEAQMISEMSRGLGQRVLVAAGQTTVKEAAALIEACDLLVCNDSGLMHVAEAVGTPVLAIYGPTDFNRTSPLAAGNTIIRHELPCSPCFKLEGDDQVRACPHHDCLMTITVDEVFNSLVGRLGSSDRAKAEGRIS